MQPPKGFTSRLASFDDISMIVAMLNQTTGDNQESFFAEDINTEWRTPNFDVSDSVRLVLSANRQLIGYIEVWDVDNPPVRPTIWGRVHPDFIQQGIGHYLMNWAENRAKQAISRCPDDLRVAYQCGCDNHHINTQKLFESMGLHHYRDSWDMEITLSKEPPAVTTPDDFIIRDYRHPDEFRDVILANEEAFEDHFGYVKKSPEQHLEQWQHLIDTDPYFDPTVWFVAEHIPSGEIAGVSICRTRAWTDPNKAYLGSLSVHRPYRRKGLAMALLKHTFRAFWLRGTKTISLSVGADNLTGATQLYKKAGMHVTRHLMMYEKELRAGTEYSTTTLNP
jgi:mycothiol synthase